MTQRHGLVLLPRFALLGASGVLDALAAANALLGRAQYAPLLLSLDGQPVRASGGIALAVEAGLDAAPALDAVYVVAGDALPDPLRDGHAERLHPWLRERAAAGTLLAGIGTGTAVLAQAGVLSGHRATLPALHVPQLAEAHAQVVFSSGLYEIDRGRLSCAAGATSVELMLAWLAQRHGDKLLAGLLAHFGLERLRARDERQPTPSAARPGGSAKLAEAVALMEANVGEPLPTEDIARLVGVSRRQLERLFKQHMDALPSRWYAELRLERARRLLQQSSQSILQIGLACGFASGSHFSNAYRARFGHTPRDERRTRAARWRDLGDDAEHARVAAAAPPGVAPAAPTPSPAPPPPAEPSHGP